jgi:hypothetical protein
LLPPDPRRLASAPALSLALAEQPPTPMAPVAAGWDDFQNCGTLTSTLRPRLPQVVEAVSQTNGIGAKQQRLGEPPETDA